MSYPQGPQPLFTHIDVTADSGPEQVGGEMEPQEEMVELLRHLVLNQDRQNELLEELVTQVSATQKQRNSELGQWKQANPALARRCRRAAEALSQVQTEFLTTMTEEIHENADALLDGGFMMHEFVDRFGPRLAHLNGVLQVLSQLSSVPNPSDTTRA